MNTTSVGHPLILAVLLLAHSTAPALADLKWRVSVKFILNPAGIFPGEVGNPDPNCESLDGSAISCVSEVEEKFAYANDVLKRTGRGYQLDLIEITTTDELTAFFDCPGCGNGEGYAQVRADLEEMVKADPGRFKWRENAFNIYIHNRDIGGRSNTRDPGNPAPLIMIGQNRSGGIVRPLHELGHALGLCHTQGCGLADCEAGKTGPGHTEPGDDGIADTLPDLGCWDLDDIADFSFGMDYADLSAANRSRVDDTFFNIMAYHADDGSQRPCSVPLDGTCRYRFTADQLDRMTDFSNRTSPRIATGRTWFVDANTPCALGDGSPSCNGLLDPLGPYQTVADGVNNALPGDIVLIRAGTYAAPPLLTKRMTLRASRGTVVMSAP